MNYEIELDDEAFDPEFDFEQETAPPGVAQKVSQQRAAMAQLRRALPRLGRYVRKDGKRFRLVMKAKSLGEAASRLGLPPATVKAMVQALKQGNLRNASAAPRRELEMEEELANCPGVTRLTTHWWGNKLLLNECHTKALVEALGVGASAAGLCAATAPVPHAKVLCAVATPLLGIGAGAIKAIDALGGNRGVVIRRPWVAIPPAPPVIIWHQ